MQIQRIAGRQHRLITTTQLHGAGARRGVIESRVRAGRLHRIHRGVYSLHSPPHSQSQIRLAAVLACGTGAALCGPTGASAQGIGEIPSAAVHVRSPTRAGRRLAGVKIHRGAIDPRDRRRVDGIPCASADIVLVDLAPVLGESELEVVLVAAESKGLLNRGRLEELIVEREGRPGIGKLRTLLALQPAIVNSELELLMLPIVRTAGLERPLVNHPIPVPGREQPLIVDFAWPALRMVVEVDGQRFHGDWDRAATDRERDQLLALAGWRCHRFVRDRFADAESMARRLAELARLSRGIADPPS